MTTSYNHFKRFTDAEDDYIKDNWQTLKDNEIASYLHRKVGSIYNRRWLLGLRRVTDYKPKKQKKYREGFLNKLNRMQYLIQVCETTDKPAVKDRAKEELKKLSGL